MSGELADAKEFVAKHYPGRECIVLSRRELREAGWRGQMKAFRKIKGEALVFFRQALSELQEPQLAAWSGVFHRCRFTVLADSSGQVVTWSRSTLLLDLPRAFASGLCDLFVFAISWMLLQVLRHGARPVSSSPREDADLDLAYLYPFPLDTSLVGGALSHVKGFLSGVASTGSRTEIFSGRPLPVADFLVQLVPARRRLFLFHESRLLSYNVRFALTVRKLLRGRRVGAIYQRHGRFIVAGPLLSRWLGVPFILEYNGSETWVAKYWDPARFRNWLSLCEETALSWANTIVVVSEPLRQDLLQRGIPAERILLNPNAVDPSEFRPECGGLEVRKGLGLTSSDIVVGFVGTFHYWHGTKVLEQAIQRLLQDATTDGVIDRLRFLLVGDGLLRTEMRDNLASHHGSRIFFTGLVSHSQIPAYLDAADILVSPHVRMPDGQPFFGSPTKIFEYMAMGKAVVASNLDQIGQVLKHEHSAWLVEPGDVAELASAVVLLSRNPALRNRLGQNARASALAGHTWQQNAERVLARIHATVPDKVEARTSVQELPG
ncbi:MAG: glycosyltransferase family 4 protein [Candidatus Sulfotelmatobacter sp.]